MDSLYFYTILRFQRLSEAFSSQSIRRISGDNKFYPTSQTEKDICTFFIFELSAIRRATLYARVLCGPTCIVTVLFERELQLALNLSSVY